MVFSGGGLAAQTNLVVLGDLVARIALVCSGSVLGEANLVVHGVSVLGVQIVVLWCGGVVLVVVLVVVVLAALIVCATPGVLVAGVGLVCSGHSEGLASLVVHGLSGLVV